MDKNILYKFFEGSATDQEIGRIREWVESSPENRRELFSARKKFDALLLLADTGKYETKQEKQISIHHIHEKRVIRLQIPHITAMLAVVFTLGILTHSYFTTEKKAEIAWYEIQAPLGAKSQVKLIDGTRVWLNAGSKLQYSTTFGQQNREVNLVGEGYFEVAKNKDLPFEVKTSELIVRALGTAFNVKAYPNEATIETILVEGEVEVLQKTKTTGVEKDQTVLLKPQQRLTLKKNTHEMLVETNLPEKEQVVDPIKIPQKKTTAPTVKTVKTTVDLMSHTSWKDKRWRIDSENLGSFATKLERRYNVKISFQDKDLPKYSFNGTFEDEPIEEVLRALALAAPINFSLKGNEVVLSRNNKFKDAYKALYELNTDN